MVVTYISKNATCSISIDVTDVKEFFIKIEPKLRENLAKPKDEQAEIRLRTSSPTEARAVLRAFAEGVRSGDLNDVLLGFVSASIDAALDAPKDDSEAFLKALGLKGRRGRPRLNDARNKKIATEVSALMEKGSTLLDASIEVAEKHHLHESNIQKAYCLYAGRAAKQEEPF